MVYKKAQRKIHTYTQFRQFRYISSTHKYLTTDLGIYKHICSYTALKKYMID